MDVLFSFENSEASTFKIESPFEGIFGNRKSGGMKGTGPYQDKGFVTPACRDKESDSEKGKSKAIGSLGCGGILEEMTPN